MHSRLHSRSGSGFRLSLRTSPPAFRLMSLVFLLLFAAGLTRAEVRLPALFTDHMVLQEGMPLRFWGWADPGESVSVTFRKQTATVQTSASGRWTVSLKAERAGGPDPLVIAGRQRLELQDVLVGEVWICSGQSNMEWPLNRSFEPQNDIAASENPNLRLFTVTKKKAVTPAEDVVGKWEPCNPSTVPGFSAVGYYFGRALQHARRVPVGLIHTSWGGSPAEAWMSEAALSANPDYRRDIVDAFAGAKRNFDEALAQWQKEKAEAEKDGKKFDKGRPWDPWRPSELYNGMIAPLLPYAARGAIWYQGESNAGRAWQYRTLFVDMIRDWRQHWGQRQFAFLAVQLAPWDRNKKRTLEQITAEPVDTDWAELREAQVIATQKLPQVGLAVITDVGDKDDIHPTKKAPVGERLALAARTIAYGERIQGLSPRYKHATFKRGQAVITFDRVSKGLEARGGALTGFAIAGPDRKFVWAKAEIAGKNKVVVSNPSVPDPVAVRFGWADYPVVNLFSRDGLPAAPFRTDDFPMVSAPKPR